MNYLFTTDNIIENSQDHVVPPDMLTFKDLGVEPKKVTEGFPIEHLRHYRVGGYDFGRRFQLAAVSPSLLSLPLSQHASSKPLSYLLLSRHNLFNS